MTAASLKPGRQTQGFQQHPQKKTKSFSANVRGGVVWNVASTLLLKFSNIGITALVARILTPHDFGVFAVASTVFTIVSAFAEFGVTSCLARADLRVGDLAPTLWSVSLGSSLLIAAALVFFARPIATELGSPDGAGPVRVMAIVMILIGVAAVPTAQCVRDFKQDKLFLANVLGFVPSTIVLLVMAKSGGGAMAFAWSRVAGQLTSSLVILAVAPRLYRPGISRGALSILFKFGLPLAVANFVGYLLQNVDYALIGHLLGPVLLGTYVIAFNSASWSSSLLTNVLATVAMPAFSRVKSDTERLMGAMTAGVSAVMLIAVPMCALVMVLARPIVLTLYGPHWVAAAGPLRLLSLYGMISIVCLLFSNMLAALGKSRFILVTQLIWLFTLIPAMTIGVHKDGIVGAASAHIAVIIPIVLPCYVLALKRATGVRILSLVRAAVPALLASAIAAIIAEFVMSMLHNPAIQLVAAGTSGVLSYAVMTAPKILVVIGHGKVANPKALRVLRAYYNLGRSLGLPVGPLPRHSTRRRGTRVRTRT